MNRTSNTRKKHPMTRNELIELLSIPEDSLEAEAMRREASALSHKRFHDTSLLLGQIGVERHACPAACRFCSFSGKRQNKQIIPNYFVFN